MSNAAPLQTIPQKAGEAQPTVTQSTTSAINPVTGATTPSKAPMEIPKDVQWGKAEQVIAAADKNVLDRRVREHAKKGYPTVVATYKIDAVQDGDGVRATPTGGGPAIDCRLDLIDAPETAKSFTKPPKPGQPGGEESLNKLKDLIENKEVSIWVTTPKEGTNYGRKLCQIEISGKNVNAEMVRTGQAYIYNEIVNKRLYPELGSYEHSAKSNKLGVHGIDGAENPAQYRKQWQSSK